MAAEYGEDSSDNAATVVWIIVRHTHDPLFAGKKGMSVIKQGTKAWGNDVITNINPNWNNRGSWKVAADYGEDPSVNVATMLSLFKGKIRKLYIGKLNSSFILLARVEQNAQTNNDTQDLAVEDRITRRFAQKVRRDIKQDLSLGGVYNWSKHQDYKLNYNIKREQQDLTKTIQIKPKYMILNVARNDNSCNEWRQFIVHQRNYDLKSGGYDWNDFISEIIDVEKDGSTMHLLEEGNNPMDVIGQATHEPQKNCKRGVY